MAHQTRKIDFLNIAPYVRYIHCHSMDGSQEYRIPPRMIYDHEIIYVVSGGCTYLIGNHEYHLRAGDIHFMRPHILHSCSAPKGEAFEYYAVHFDLIYMGEALDFSPELVYLHHDYPRLDLIPLEEDLADRLVIELSEVEFPYLLHTREPQNYLSPFRELLTAFQEKPYGYHLTMRSIMLRILGLMVKDVATRDGVEKDHQHQKEITETIRYMYSHYAEDIDLNSVPQLYLSPNYFRTLFKQATGKTQIEFLTNIRLEKAKSLMLDGKYSIGQVSAMVGYQDYHYFSKLFKKSEGLSPKNYMDSLTRHS